MSPTKIFRCRILKQFVNQITLLCDGKCHCNAAKTVLRQLIVVHLLNFPRTRIIDKFSDIGDALASATCSIANEPMKC